MTLRSGLRLWHRWFGILIGGWLVLLAITGMAIAWYDELDTALNPDLREVAVSQRAPVPLDLVITNAKAALPGLTIRNAILAPEPGTTHWLSGPQSLPDGSVRSMQVFIDPASGAVVGTRESGALQFDRQHLPDLVYGLHTELLAHEIGATIIGIIGLLWLLDHFLSLPLAIPRRHKWAEAFQMMGKRGSLRRLFDWHRAKGMWMWLLTFTITLTGVTLAFPNASRDLVRPFSNISERLHETMPDATGETARIGIDEAVSLVTSDRTGVYSIRPFPDLGLYAVRTYDPRDPDNQGRLWTYVSTTDGEIVGRRHDNGESAGDFFFAWQYPLHSGHAAGIVGRIIVTLVGLLTLLLCYSGLRLVWRRRRSSRTN